MEQSKTRSGNVGFVGITLEIVLIYGVELCHSPSLSLSRSCSAPSQDLLHLRRGDSRASRSLSRLAKHHIQIGPEAAMRMIFAIRHFRSLHGNESFCLAACLVAFRRKFDSTCEFCLRPSSVFYYDLELVELYINYYICTSTILTDRLPVYGNCQLRHVSFEFTRDYHVFQIEKACVHIAGGDGIHDLLAHSERPQRGRM